MHSETRAAQSHLAILFVAVFVAQASGQTTAPTIAVDPRAALVEVILPPELVQSPAAAGLAERLVRNYAIMLEQPGLTIMAMQRPDMRGPELWRKLGTVSSMRKAVHARAIAGSNLIELFVDPDVCGDDAVKVAEAIVEQHIENQKTLVENEALEQTVKLKQLRERYEFRRDELQRDMRERLRRMHEDGISIDGRSGVKELELNKLIDLKFDLERRKLDAALDAAKAIDAQLEKLQERIGPAKTELADARQNLDAYLTMKDDLEVTREKLRDVTARIDQIWRSAEAARPPLRWVQRPIKGE